MSIVAKFVDNGGIEELTALCADRVRVKLRAQHGDWSGGLTKADLPTRQIITPRPYKPMIPIEDPVTRIPTSFIAVSLITAFIAVVANNPLADLSFDFWSAGKEPVRERIETNPNVGRFAAREMARMPDCGLVPGLPMTCYQTMMRARIR